MNYILLDHNESKGLNVGQGRELRNDAVWMGVGVQLEVGWPGYRIKHSTVFFRNLAKSSEGKRAGRTDNRVLINYMT